MSNNPIQLVPTKSDAEFAEELKQRLIAAYEPVCKILDEGSSAGFIINVNVGPNPFGKHAIAQIMIARRYVP
jgi:hypothetical protein